MRPTKEPLTKKIDAEKAQGGEPSTLSSAHLAKLSLTWRSQLPEAFRGFLLGVRVSFKVGFTPQGFGLEFIGQFRSDGRLLMIRLGIIFSVTWLTVLVTVC